MDTIKNYLEKPFAKHILFWIVVFSSFVFSRTMSYYKGYFHVFEVYFIIVSIQIITAYTSIYILIPKFLNKKKIFLFAFYLIALLIAMFLLYNFFRVYYIDLKYFEVYAIHMKEYAKIPYWERFSDFPLFLSKSILFITPGGLLLMLEFYRNQQAFLKLSEQKKVAELTALKNQLNPHFLFNTLNNIYTLSLEKSDKTPEVIERLADILDYMLYRCDDTFVSLNKEITLIENYLALEKIRYGKRVNISFTKDVEKDVNIAPLILLTFIENAFKHGVSQELKTAEINISITLQGDSILFSIYNTKPNNSLKTTDQKSKMLGLKNVIKQLDLLYLNNYDLEIKDEQKSYTTTLKLIQK
ncbi:hypothetical protein WH52_05475 [Tenacibaculum holothuriorum]|uniref:Signal transduction histidine kinase internal region domain-containing protein n=1 Tax=Tenacibaculum holothuriorum TaxID=1635173 RepID=A0A1Y2PE14_9FLAO|nr:sensor histidine kinase [Tenacibaculum holothuriorum]OSY88231.1 hypothetical protein WH52_05475 [Tenacibaculum holothuriorum]